MALPPVSRRQFLNQAAAWGAVAFAPRLSRAAETPPARRLGVALVGLGGYAGLLARGIQETKRCRLAGVVSGTPAKLPRWAAQYGLPERSLYHYDNLERIADNPDIDAVYIVTPPGTHRDFVVRAAKTGKHVICEKPMEVSAARCAEMVAACRAAGVTLSIGYRLHYEPNTAEFIRLAREQEFGPFMRMSSANGFRMGGRSWRVNKQLAGGGPLMDMGVYVIQAVCMAKAEAAPVAVTARFGEVTRPQLFNEVEESVSWTMEFADGAQAECRASYGEGVSRFRAEAGSDWVELGPTAFYYNGQSLTTSRGPRSFPAVNHQAAQMEGMAAELLAGGPTRVPGEMGRRDIAITDAIYASAAAEGKRIEVRM